MTIIVLHVGMIPYAIIKNYGIKMILRHNFIDPNITIDCHYIGTIYDGTKLLKFDLSGF